MAKQSTAPLRVQAFAHLAFAYLVNELGNWLGEVALAVIVFDATDSALATAALFLAMQALPALAAPALVARLEAFDASATLPSLYLGEAAAFGALAALAPNIALAVALPIAAIDGLCGAAARALTRGSVAALLLPRNLLREGNAVLNLAFTIAAAAGPALAGGLVAIASPRFALLADAGSFAGVALVVGAARGLPIGRPRAGRQRGLVREALAHVRANPRLRVLIGCQAIAIVFFSVVIPIEVVFAKATLGSGNFGYGALLASWGIGMVGGGAAFAAMTRRPLALLLGASTLAVGFAYLGTAVAPTLLVACLASVVGGAGNGVQFVGVVTAVQELTAERFQARVASLLDTVSRASPGIGFAIGGVVAAAASPRLSYAVAGFGVVAVLAFAATRLRAAGWSGARAVASVPAAAAAPVTAPRRQAERPAA